jgi:hypothetical protein
MELHRQVFDDAWIILKYNAHWWLLTNDTLSILTWSSLEFSSCTLTERSDMTTVVGVTRSWEKNMQINKQMRKFQADTLYSKYEHDE